MTILAAPTDYMAALPERLARMRKATRAKKADRGATPRLQARRPRRFRPHHHRRKRHRRLRRRCLAVAGRAEERVAGLRLLALVIAVVALWLLVYGALIAPGRTLGSRDLAEPGTLLPHPAVRRLRVPRRSPLAHGRSRAWNCRLERGRGSGLGGLQLPHRTRLGRRPRSFRVRAGCAARGPPRRAKQCQAMSSSSYGRRTDFAVRAHVDDGPLTLLVDPGASFVTLTLAAP